MSVTVKDIVSQILSQSSLILRFSRLTEQKRWNDAVARLNQIQNGAFMAQDEVEFFIDISENMLSDEELEGMFCSWNKHEAHAHANHLGD